MTPSLSLEPGPRLLAFVFDAHIVAVLPDDHIAPLKPSRHGVSYHCVSYACVNDIFAHYNISAFSMVCDFFHPNVGGAENHIYMLASNLIKRGHKVCTVMQYVVLFPNISKVIVITHSYPPSRVGVRWLVPGLKVYYIPLRTIASSATLPNFFCFLPYFRTIIVREGVQIVHGHASLSSMTHESILHAHHLGVRTVFTDHSLFGFDDAASILTNKLLEGALRNADRVICVSHTGRENTVLRARLFPEATYVIPNAIVADQFKPTTGQSPTDSSG